MIQVLLLILKIIGIAVLAVLGAVLLVLTVVLFVPVFYRVRIIHNPQKTQVKARVSFLFPAVIATIEYLKKLSFKVRIFGILLLDSEKPKKEKKPKEKKVRKQGKNRKKVNPQETEKKEKEKIPKQEEREPEQLTVSELPDEKEEPEDKKEQTAEKQGLFDKIKSKIKKIRETISNIVNKIKRLFRQKEEAQRIFAKQETKTALKFVWDKLKHLLKHVLPRKVKGCVSFGADDPATTGQILGILSVVYARTGELLIIRPDFTQKRLETDMELRGRIQLFTLLVIAVKVFLNPELRQLITEVKGIKEIE